MTDKKPIRCAIYTRKSHEEGLEQEFNSLDAQRVSGEAYVQSQLNEGWQCLPTRYDDAGFSGGNLERPGLTRLMGDIERGQIDCVVVYKVDRLSRSLLDFARLIAHFDEHGVSFVSVTQQFNTTTSMGRLTLNILLSFAQFEREIIGERIRDKKLATARQGKYVGGSVPLGYKVADGKLVVNEREAKLVQHIYRLYTKHQSCHKVATALNAEGHRAKLKPGKPWTQKHVNRIITCRTYTGKIVHKGTAYPGEHEAIISDKQFERAAEIRAANLVNVAGHNSRRFVLLRGMMRCGHCGGTIAGYWSSNHDCEYHYYVCRRKPMATGRCPLPSLQSGRIETVVIDQVRALLRHPDVIARTYRHVRQDSGSGPDDATLARLTDMRQRGEQTQKSIRAVLNCGADSGFMADELKRLRDELRIIEQDIAGIESRPGYVEPIELDRVRQSLQKIDPVWEMLVPEEQRRILQLLIESITVSTTGLDIRFRPNGIEEIVRELQPIEERTSA